MPWEFRLFGVQRGHAGPLASEVEGFRKFGIPLQGLPIQGFVCPCWGPLVYGNYSTKWFRVGVRDTLNRLLERLSGELLEVWCLGSFSHAFGFRVHIGIYPNTGEPL